MSITFDNVRYCYGNVCALKDARFSVRDKGLTALVGPNGGGKSTIIRLMVGLIEPDNGKIEGGKAVGYVPQSPSFDLCFPVTVRDLVLMGTLGPRMRPFCRYTAAQKKTAEEAIARVGLFGMESRGIGQLSGGQRGRALIARALASDAAVIALDEPDASLDADAARELYALLDVLRRDKAIVMASHHIGAVLDIADTAVYVNNTARAYLSPGKLKEDLRGGMAL